MLHNFTYLISLAGVIFCLLTGNVVEGLLFLVLCNLNTIQQDLNAKQNVQIGQNQ